MTRRSTLLAAVLAAATSLAAAGTAVAESIVYVKDRNVWVTAPDGSGNRQVTFDGAEYSAYLDPTQSDDGTIWAAKGEDIVKLDQQGTVMASWDPPATVDSAGGTLDGVPQDLAVTPDGRTLAFTYYRYGCPVGADCGARTTTVFSHADRPTPVAELGYELNLRNPEWVSNERVLLFGGRGRQVAFDRTGTGDYDATHWFDDPGNEDLGDGELSPQGDRLAALRSYGADLHLAIFAVGSTSQTPELACTSGSDESLSDPDWSPDGRRLAFQNAQGIEVLGLPSVTPGDCAGAQSSTLVIPGGTQPDWGPAAVQPRYEVEADVAPGTTLGKALRKGLRLRVKTNIAGTLRGRMLVGQRKVGTGRVTLDPGSGTLVLRFTKAARRAYRNRSKPLKITVDLTHTPPAGNPFGVTGTVEVRP